MTADAIAAKERWRGCPLDIRQRYLSSEIFVPHPAYMRVINEIRRMAKRCKNEGKGRAILVLVGSGGGKTHLARTLTNLWPRDDSGEKSIVPVVVFDIPPSPTAKSLGSELLKALNDPKPEYGKASKLLERGVLLLDTADNLIVCIDNFHDIAVQRRDAGVMQLGDWTRDLINDSKRLVVLLGTHAARQITEANAQLRRRVAKRMEIAYFSIDSDSTIARLRRFLHELDKGLPLAEMSNLDNPDLTKKIMWATYGIIDYIFDILCEAISFAVDDGREQIIESDLAKGFAAFFQDAGKDINPFTKGGPARPLDQPDEPFHDWYDTSNPNPRTWQEKLRKK